MRRFRFSLLVLLLLLTLTSLCAGWISYRLELQRLAAREAYKKRLTSRLEWLEEERNNLEQELDQASKRYFTDSDIYWTLNRPSDEIQRINNYIDATKKELNDLQRK